MGIILSKTKESKTPYVIKKTGVRIYSVEELCYYICNNIYLIDKDFFSRGLIDYLKNELKLVSIAQGIDNLVLKKAEVHEIVSFLLRNVDYYGVAKITEVVRVSADMSSKDETGRYMAMAGDYLKNNCVRRAIDDYKKAILSTDDDKVRAVAYYNIGVAHAKLFDYKKAFAYFHESYEIEKSGRMLEAMYKAAIMHKLGHNEDLMEIPASSKDMIMNYIEKSMNEVSISTSLQEELKDIDSGKEEKICDMISQLKKRYQVMV